MQAWALGGALALAGTLGAGQAGAASSPPFVDNGDGTVSDTSTGLMWDQCADGLSGNGSCNAGTAAFYTWANALRRAGAQSAANYKGYPDWRLPTIVELRTLDKVGSSNPAIDGIGFPNTPADGFWSGSLYALSPSLVWVVYFQDGSAAPSFKSNFNYVRLVRSGQSFDSFVGVFPIGVSGVTASAATLSATSSGAATGYWLVVPRDATSPSSAQIIAGASYGTVTVVAHGSGAMVAKTPASLAINGLTLGTAYDLYLVAKEGSYQTTSNTAGPIPFSTADIAASSIVIDPSTPSTLYAALDGAGCMPAPTAAPPGRPSTPV